MAPNLAAIEKCLICHGKADLVKVEATGRQVSLHVDESVLKTSVHGDKECTDCHIDIVEIPHRGVLKVNCRRCHYAGNPVGAPEGQMYDQYEHSVHGLAVVGGNDQAPVCQDCHGAHDIAAPESEASRVSKHNRPATCGRCHIDEYVHFQQSVHGEALASGISDAPDCASCHGEHNIMDPGKPGSSVFSEAIVHTCGECHGPLGVATKYGIDADRTRTFEESFHGVASMMGSTTVANCASCHGYHDVLGTDNPRSSVNPANIVATCGQADCHPEATPQFASGKIHIDPTSEESGILYWVTQGFTVLTVSVLAGLFFFILLDLFRRAKKARQKHTG
jgi:hypothetical protein